VIGVTGASGHLGGAILDLLPDSYPIGRNLPEQPLNGIIHCAAPNYRDEVAVGAFTDFALNLNNYARTYGISNVVVVGSWWQYAKGTCTTLLYTHLKNMQTRLFRQAAHVIPYSIYGDEPRQGRGFIPQMIQAINTGQPLQGLSAQPRDFIHVTDVARACIAALAAPRGIYLAGTRSPESPRCIATRYGVTAPDYAETPSALPAYPFPNVPSWEPLTHLDEHIRSRLT
jgi:nucleoside-diphosphate-sugar epimerase